MMTLNEIETVRRDLESELSSRYRKIWIQRTRLGSIVITLFPLKGEYDIITRKLFKDWTREGILGLINGTDNLEPLTTREKFTRLL